MENQHVIDIIMRQMNYLDLKEKYMRYHRRQGARNALESFGLPEKFMPPDEFKYTQEEITDAEEQWFRENEDTGIGGIMREEQILGAVAALRAAGVDDDRIVDYIAKLWGISEGYAGNHLVGEDNFADRVGMVM